MGRRSVTLSKFTWVYFINVYSACNYCQFNLHELGINIFSWIWILVCNFSKLNAISNFSLPIIPPLPFDWSVTLKYITTAVIVTGVFGEIKKIFQHSTKKWFPLWKCLVRRKCNLEGRMKSFFSLKVAMIVCNCCDYVFFNKKYPPNVLKNILNKYA